MKILLVGNYPKDHQFSMQKFSDCLSAELIKLGHQVRVCRPTVIFGAWFESTNAGIAKWLGYLDKYLLFPIHLLFLKRWADIVHVCDHSNAMYLPYILKTPHLITCHDLMAVRSAIGEFHENNRISKTGKLQQQWIIKSLSKARNIAAVSNATKEDVLRLAKVPQDNVTVIHNGLNYAFNPVNSAQALALLNKYGITENMQFLLHVGGNQWYKNRTGVLAIFNHIIRQQSEFDLKLIMAGKSFSNEMTSFIQEHDLTDKVIELVEPSTEELAALYSLATAFLFPSLCEGFGWPIIEAQACNTLVFTSNRQPMTEVGGQAAIYLDPEVPEQAALIILNSLNDTQLVEKTLNAIPFNLSQFTTELMANKYSDLYQSIVFNQGTV